MILYSGVRKNEAWEKVMPAGSSTKWLLKGAWQQELYLIVCNIYYIKTQWSMHSYFWLQNYSLLIAMKYNSWIATIRQKLLLSGRVLNLSGTKRFWDFSTLTETRTISLGWIFQMCSLQLGADQWHSPIWQVASERQAHLSQMLSHNRLLPLVLWLNFRLLNLIT